MGSGLGAKVALVTDGRFSGATHSRQPYIDYHIDNNMCNVQVLWWGMCVQKHSVAVT